MKRALFAVLWLSVAVAVTYGTAQSEAAARPVKLVATFWGGQSDQANVDEIGRLFTQANPNVSVEALLITGDYDAKLLTMIAGGTPPDVQGTLRFTFYSLVAKGTVLNLQPYLDKIGFKREPYYEVGLDPWTIKGKLYGLPKGIDAWTLYYNKDIFDAAGVGYPTGAWTRDDLVANAKKLTRRNPQGVAQQFGFAWNGTGGAKAFTCYVYQADGRIVDDIAEPAKWLMAEPEATEAVQFMADLATVHKVMPSPQERTDLGGPVQLFKSGRLAMLYGEWFGGSNYRGSKFNWTIAEPARGKKRATWVGGGAWCVNAKGKHIEDSVELVVFMAGPEGSKVMGKNLGGIPNVKAIAESPLFLDNKPPDNNRAVLDSFAYGVQPPMSPTFPEWDRIVLSALDPVWTGEKKAKDALPPIVREVQAKVEEGRKMMGGL